MTQKQTGAPLPPGLGLGDIYHILFRRKWMIVGGCVCGFVAAAMAFALWNPTYSSTAILLVAKIEQAPDPTQIGTGRRDIEMVNAGSAMAAEQEIMNSLDSLKKVAENIGPARIMAKYTRGTNVSLNVAAQMIQASLFVDSPRYSPILKVTFSSRSPEIVTNVLGQVIAEYLEKHSQTYQRKDVDWITREIQMRQDRLNQTEVDLAKLKGQYGITTLAEAMAAYKQQEGAIKQLELMAQADWAESLARLTQLSNIVQDAGPTAATNATAPNPAKPPSEQTRKDYRQASGQLVDLEANEAKLESKYNTNNLQVQANLIDIQVAKAKLRSLEDENPGLLMMGAKEEGRTIGSPGLGDPLAAYNSESTRAEGLKAKIRAYAAELELFKERGTNLTQIGVTITDLERIQASEEESLKQLTTQTDVARADSAASEYKAANISVIQHPSPPASDVKKSYKTVQGLAIGGVILGFGMAFLWEMLLDRTLKRPKEVVARLRLPYFLTVPYMNGSSRVRWFQRDKQTKLKLPGSGGDSSKTAVPENNALVPAHDGPVPPWDEKHALRPFHETLRDRLVAYFEMHQSDAQTQTGGGDRLFRGGRGEHHRFRPGLFPVRNGRRQCAAGGHELGNGQAHHFYKGKLAMGLDDILEKEKTNRQSALVQENLYVVKESNQDKLPASCPNDSAIWCRSSRPAIMITSSWTCRR
jgi:uncharacterized protein involved in exopolysaccharide biosynthesis